MKVAEEDTAASSTNINDKIITSNDQIYKLVEKQVEELEKIGKQMVLNLKNSYDKELLAQQNEVIKTTMDYKEIEKIYKKYEEKFISNSQLIGSLRARIEELEIDSITKDQDIKKLRYEFNVFAQTTQAQNETTTSTTIPGTTSELSETQPSTLQEGFIHEYVDGTLLKCKICENIFISNKEFNKHARLEHKMKYICFNCSEVFQSKVLRRKHILEYHTIYCNYCNKIFSARSAKESLEKHVKEIHLNSQEYSDVIDEQQEISYEENLHTTTTNEDNGFFLHETFQGRSGVAIMQCKECKKTFNSHVRFRYHAKDIHNYEWLCLVCCQVFLSRGTRGKHMRLSHTQDFSCTLCSKKCYDKIGMHQHFRAKHPGKKFTSTQTPPTLTSNQMPPMLTSNQTPLTLTSPPTSQPDVLFIHEIILSCKIPTNKKTPYQLKCKICNVIFDTHANFNLHAKTSHDYKCLCNFCSQVFSQKSLKKKHTELFHLYNCQDCNRKFRTENSLKDHCRAKNHKMILRPTYLSPLQFSQSRGVRIIDKRPNYLETANVSSIENDDAEDEVDYSDDNAEEEVDESEEYSDDNTEDEVDESEGYSDDNAENEVVESEESSDLCDDDDTEEEYRTRKA